MSLSRSIEKPLARAVACRVCDQRPAGYTVILSEQERLVAPGRYFYQLACRCCAVHSYDDVQSPREEVTDNWNKHQASVRPSWSDCG